MARDPPSGVNSVSAEVLASATQRFPHRSRAAPEMAARVPRGWGGPPSSRIRALFDSIQVVPAGPAHRVRVAGAGGPWGTSSVPSRRKSRSRSCWKMSSSPPGARASRVGVFSHFVRPAGQGPSLRSGGFWRRCLTRVAVRQAASWASGALGCSVLRRCSIRRQPGRSPSRSMVVAASSMALGATTEPVWSRKASTKCWRALPQCPWSRQARPSWSRASAQAPASGKRSRTRLKSAMASFNSAGLRACRASRPPLRSRPSAASGDLMYSLRRRSRWGMAASGFRSTSTWCWANRSRTFGANSLWGVVWSSWPQVSRASL